MPFFSKGAEDFLGHNYPFCGWFPPLELGSKYVEFPAHGNLVYGCSTLENLERVGAMQESTDVSS